SPRRLEDRPGLAGPPGGHAPVRAPLHAAIRDSAVPSGHLVPELGCPAGRDRGRTPAGARCGSGGLGRSDGLRDSGPLPDAHTPRRSPLREMPSPDGVPRRLPGGGPRALTRAAVAMSTGGVLPFTAGNTYRSVTS